MAHDRAHLGCGVERIADAHRARACSERLDEPVLHARVREQARARAADLALVREDAPERGLDDLIQVRIGEDDERRLAAELEAEALQVRVGARVQQLARGRDRAGERDLVHVAVPRERLAGLRTEAR
jgi:hypothetical protein